MRVMMDGKDEDNLTLERQRPSLSYIVTERGPAASTSTAGAQERQPLIHYVTNQWRDEKRHASHAWQQDEDSEPSYCGLDDDLSCSNVTRNLSQSRQVRKMLAVVIAVLLAVYYVWSRFLRPWYENELSLKEGFVSQHNGTYGLALGGDDPNLVRLQTLDPDLLPGGNTDPRGERRLVFVGDVHGCSKELRKLLLAVEFNERTDHLILTGDVVSKGPDSPGVLDELIRLGATSVRGNHEDRLLTAAQSVRASEFPPSSAAATSKGTAKDAALLRTLGSHHLQYLRRMPLALYIPALPMAVSSITSTHLFSSSPSEENIQSSIPDHMLVVHAGLVPGVPLLKQDPYFVMNMRSIHRRTHVPSVTAAPANDKNMRPWIDLWGWYNDRIAHGKSLKGFTDAEADGALATATMPSSSLSWASWWARPRPRPQPQVVLYGHDSKAGLKIRRWSKGLDSGCVGGGQLTALVLDARGRQEIVKVDCKERIK